ESAHLPLTRLQRTNRIDRRLRGGTRAPRSVHLQSLPVCEAHSQRVCSIRARVPSAWPRGGRDRGQLPRNASAGLAARHGRGGGSGGLHVPVLVRRNAKSRACLSGGLHVRFLLVRSRTHARLSRSIRREPSG